MSNFVFHHPPVHCSWMNQVEQWFSILQRKRLKISDFTEKKVLQQFDIKTATKVINLKDVKKKIIKKWQHIQS
ncbi:MAG: hypothetical protein V7K48_01740, partial [Nostoc sp.]